MKKSNNIKNKTNKVADSLQIPPELSRHASNIQLLGRNVLFIENYKGMICCDDTEIVLLTPCYKVAITGFNLEVAYYTNDDMKIQGCINTISFLE